MPVKTFPDERAVLLCRFLGEHGTATASAAAGKGFFGGRMHGAAPEAQLVAVAGNTRMLHGSIEAYILAVKHPKVDIVTIQNAVFQPLNDGSSTTSRILDRLVERYRKPIFVGTGNSGPASNLANEYCAGRHVMCVGAYVHRDTWRAVYGLLTPRDEYIALSTAAGPRADGGFKPDAHLTSSRRRRVSTSCRAIARGNQQRPLTRCPPGTEGRREPRSPQTLPLNIPVSLTVTVNPKTVGTHSAILNLIDADGVLAHQVMSTVIVAEQFTAEQSYRIEREGRVEWMDYTTISFSVPPGASVLTLDLQIAEGNLMMNPHAGERRSLSSKLRHVIPTCRRPHDTISGIFGRRLGRLRPSTRRSTPSWTFCQ